MLTRDSICIGLLYQFYHSIFCSKGTTSCLFLSSEAGRCLLRRSNAEQIWWAHLKYNPNSSRHQCSRPTPLILHLFKGGKQCIFTPDSSGHKPGQWLCPCGALGYRIDVRSSQMMGFRGSLRWQITLSKWWSTICCKPSLQSVLAM